MRDGLKIALLAVTLLTTAALALAPPAAAQDTITRAQADQILEELRRMRLLLERLAAPPSPGGRQSAVSEHVTVGAGTMPALGRSDAPLTIVEFTDYQCPFCQRFHLTTFNELVRNYVDTGRVRYVSRDLPLPMHEHAKSAAQAARCAGEQTKFWEMRHALIANANRLGDERYTALARELNLDESRFQACVTSQKYADEIQRDMADAYAAGVTATPSFVIGRASGNNVEGVRVTGALPYAVFEAKIKELLAGR